MFLDPRAIARLVELRINAPADGPGYDTSYVYLEAPTLDEPAPDDNSVKLLGDKLVAIRQACEQRDYWLINVLVMHPQALERSLIQNTHQHHDLEQRERWIDQVANLFAEVGAGEIFINQNRRQALVRFNEEVTLPFAWFDGPWQFVDN